MSNKPFTHDPLCRLDWGYGLNVLRGLCIETTLDQSNVTHRGNLYPTTRWSRGSFRTALTIGDPRAATKNPVQCAQRVGTIGPGGKEMKEDFDEPDMNRLYRCIQTTLDLDGDLTDEERAALEDLRGRIGSQLDGCLV